MNSLNFTHDSVPQILEYIVQKLNDIERKIDALSSTQAQSPEDRWLNIEDLCAYLPQHPAKQTVYGWTSNNLIPHYKNGKTISFLKSEIDAWLLNQVVRSKAQLAQEAEAFVAAKKGGRRA